MVWVWAYLLFGYQRGQTNPGEISRRFRNGSVEGARRTLKNSGKFTVRPT